MNGCTDEQIAMAAHAACMALQAMDGDEDPAQPWACEDPGIKAVTVEGVRRARAGMTPGQLHEAWCAAKRAQGWTYGPVKDRVARTHPNLVPYGELPEHQQVKDRLLAAITAALSGQVTP